MTLNKLSIIVCSVVLLTNVALGKYNREDEKNLSADDQKAISSLKKLFTELGPEKYKEMLKKDSPLGDDKSKEIFSIIQVMLLEKAINGVEPDSSYLKSIYEDHKLDSSLRFQAAGALYGIADELEYLIYQCKVKPKLMAGTFGRMRNDHYDDVLIRAISGAVVEMPPLKASGYAPSPYTDFLTVDFVSTCKAIKKQGVKDYYTNLLFKLIPYFKQQRKLDVIKAAKEICPVSSRKVARQFVAAIMDADMIEEVLAIKGISKEYQKLINDIAQERMTAYSVYLDAPGSSAENN